MARVTTYDQSVIERARELRRKGYSIGAIADELAVPYSTLIFWTRDLKKEKATVTLSKRWWTPKHQARSDEFHELLKAGATLAAIGANQDPPISKQRVSALLVKGGHAGAARKKSVAAAARNLRAAKVAIEAGFAEGKALNTIIGENPKVPRQTFHRAVNLLYTREKRDEYRHKNGVKPYFTDNNDLIKALQEAATLNQSEGLTMEEYDTIKAAHDRKSGRRWPSAQTIITNLGGWNDAKVAAGLKLSSRRGVTASK
jgi:hypothetical protein